MQRPAASSAPASAWTLHDGHAGNLRQAQALARALDLPARDFALPAHAPWRWLAPRRLPGSSHAFGARFADAMHVPPALAIGCGRQAALATRVLRGHGARVVQILDPRIAPRHWDLVVVPEHDRLRGDNVIPLLGSLHPVDDAWLAEARAAFPAFGALPGPRTAVLVGGPSRHARLLDGDLGALLDAVAARAMAEDGSVLATTSRRTPDALRALLQPHLAGAAHLAWTGEADGPNPYAGLLAWADRIVCTADSVNMLSEACATRVPVFVAGLDGLQGRPRAFADCLLERGRIRRFEPALGSFTCTPLRETARVAEAVRARLGL